MNHHRNQASTQPGNPNGRDNAMANGELDTHGCELRHDSIDVNVAQDRVILAVGGRSYVLGRRNRPDARDDIDTLLRLSAAAMRAAELLRNPAARKATEQAGIDDTRWIQPR